MANGDGEQASDERYVPHLGDMMNGIQVHHAKLWWAGEAANWELAAFCLEELAEGIEDMERFRPYHDGMDLRKYSGAILAPAVDTVEAAISAQNRARFERAYGVLTQSCNSCHRATGHPYLKIRRPEQNSFLNQEF
jgi:mono/diheme cytochrome c family protein